MVTEIGFVGEVTGEPQFKDGKVLICLKTNQISLEAFERLLNDLKIEEPHVHVKINFPSVP